MESLPFKQLPKHFRSFLPPISCLTLLALQIGLHYSEEDQSTNFSSYRFAQAHLKTLPENTILLLTGDSVYYPINYLQHCEHYRSDVFVIPRGLMSSSWMNAHFQQHFGQNSSLQIPPQGPNQPFQLKKFIDANFGKSTLYISGYDPLENSEWEKYYKTWPMGFTSIIFKQNDPKIFTENLLKTSIEILQSLDFSDLSIFPRESWENFYFRTYKEIYSRLAMSLTVMAQSDPQHSRLYLDLARTHFQEYFKNNPYPAPQAFQNWKSLEQMH